VGLSCAARLLPALAGLDEGAAALAMWSLRVMTAKERCAGVRRYHQRHGQRSSSSKNESGRGSVVDLRNQGQVPRLAHGSGGGVATPSPWVVQGNHSATKLIEFATILLGGAGQNSRLRSRREFSKRQSSSSRCSRSLVCFRAASAGEVVLGIPGEYVRCSDR